jgi:hypothetical protein
MLYQTYRNAGFLQYEGYYGKRKTKIEGFLEESIKGFVYHSATYIRQFEETNYAFSEQQLHGALIDAFLRQNAYVLTECPIWRIYDKRKKVKKEDHSGHIDYFVQVDSINYFIELKHSFVNIDRENISTETLDRWNNAKNQVETIRKGIKDFEVRAAKVNIPFALMICPIYKKHNSQYSQEEIGTKLTSLFGKLKTQLEPGFLAIFQAHDELVEKGKYDWEDSPYYYYGCLFAVDFGKLNK